MLVSLNDVLKTAEERSCAIAAINTPNLESLRAVIDSAEKFGVPVILGHAELHEEVAPLDIIGPVMLLAAEQSKVPVCVHLDHCETLSYMERALELGFTGVMYDGSVLPYEENVANTITAVRMAKKYGAGVEAEIGQMASREGGTAAAGPVYTDPDVAEKFVQETGIDALAASFGTAHGIYKSKPVLDIDRVAAIKEKTGIPLVMHGGSGVSPEDYRKSIKAGIRKINYYSYMARAGVSAVSDMLNQGDLTFYHDAALAAQKAMAADVEKAMKVFYGI